MNNCGTAIVVHDECVRFESKINENDHNHCIECLDHVQCFKCHHCGSLLFDNDLIYLESDKKKNKHPRCRKCYEDLLDKCHRCNQPLMVEQFIMIDDSNSSSLLFHEECFRCDECDKVISEKFYHDDRNRYLCEVDYCKSLRFQCADCKKPIYVFGSPTNNNQMWTADNGQSYHLKCLICQFCNKQFKKKQNDINTLTFYISDKGLKCCEQCFSKCNQHQKYEKQSGTRNSCSLRNKPTDAISTPEMMLKSRVVSEKRRKIKMNLLKKTI